MGRFLQVSGLRFEFDPRHPKGNRVVRNSVQVREPDYIMHPLDENEIYHVAMKLYTFNRSDGYEPGDHLKILRTSDKIIPDMVAHYIVNGNGERPGDLHMVPSIAP